MNITAKAIGRGRFRASIADRVVCPSTRTPFFDAARVLQREGIAADTVITMTHEGSSMVCLKATVGAASGLSVLENDRHGPRLARYRGIPEGLHAEV